MRSGAFIIFCLILFFPDIPIKGQDYKLLTEPITGITGNNGIEKPVTIKVIYENYFELGVGNAIVIN
jgi:hypothetical protein